MFMSGMDIGEKFLNVVLHESMQVLWCGVDLIAYFGVKYLSPKRLWDCGSNGHGLQWD
jgi:hypothetical protein